MIEINLLPENLRKNKKKNYLKLDIRADKLKLFIGCGVIGILVLLILIPSLGSLIRRKQIHSLARRERKISKQKTQVETLDKERAILKTKMITLNEITKRDFLWSKKLNELSDIILPGIWFTRIYTDSKNRLILEGSVISKEEEAMASVGKFMKDISEKNSFFKDFDNIKLESVQRENINDRNIVKFIIALYFKNHDRS